MAAQTLGASSWQTTDAANNTSTVYVTVTLYSNGWSYDGYSCSHYVYIGGQQYGGGGPNTLYSPNTWSTTYSRTFTHDANGYRGDVGCSAEFYGAGPYVPGYLSAGAATQGAVNYDRKPAAPSSVTSVLNADKSITVTSNAVSSPAGTATYYVSYAASSDGGANFGSWSSYTTIPGNSRAYTYTLGSLTPGYTYKFQMYASNSDGSSAATATTSNVFLPAGAKRYDGAAWKTGTVANIYNGSAWVPITTAKRYNGTDWVNLT